MTKPNLRFKEFSDKWENINFKDIFKVNQGLAIKIENRFVEYKTGMYKYITHKYLNGKEKCFYIKAPSQSVICNKNDILMTRTGNTGVVITNVEGVFHNNFFKIDYDRKVHFKEFIYYILTSKKMQSNILSLAGTSTIPDLNHGDFYSIQSSIPTLAEQEKIGKFLMLIDKRINLLTTQKSKLEDYKKTLSTKLLTQKIRFKGFTDDWQTFKLGDIVHIKSCSSKSKYMENNGMYSIIDMGAINHNGRILPHKKTNHNKDILNINDLVMVKDDIGKGYIIGKVCLISCANQYICGDHVYKLSIDDLTKYCPLYLFYIINSNNTHKEIRRKANGTAQLGISLDTVKNLNIPIPTLAEQQKIARVLSNIDKLIQRKQTSLTQTITYKKYLLQNMFI